MQGLQPCHEAHGKPANGEGYGCLLFPAACLLCPVMETPKHAQALAQALEGLA